MMRIKPKRTKLEVFGLIVIFANLIGCSDAKNLLDPLVDAPSENFCKQDGYEGDIRRRPASLQGVISGQQFIRIGVPLTSEETYFVQLKSTVGSTYFDLLPPGGEPSEAFYVGSTQAVEPNIYAGKAPITGEYVVLIYLTGNARDSGETESYTLNIC